MVERYLESGKKVAVDTFNILENIERNNFKKINTWINEGLVTKERVEELKGTLKQAKEMKWNAADRLNLTTLQRALLLDYIKNGKEKEVNEFVNSLKNLRETSFIKKTINVDSQALIEEAKRNLTPLTPSKIEIGEIKIIKTPPLEGDLKIKEEEEKAPPRKFVSISKKEIADAKEIAREIAKAIQKGDYETVESLLPNVKKGEKWFGGASGIWVDKRIAVLQALYNEIVEGDENKIKVDGVFGEQTATAIKNLQKWAGLTGKSVDGYYDGETRDALIEWAKSMKEEVKDALTEKQRRKPSDEEIKKLPKETQEYLEEVKGVINKITESGMKSEPLGKTKKEEEKKDALTEKQDLKEIKEIIGEVAKGESTKPLEESLKQIKEEKEEEEKKKKKEEKKKEENLEDTET